MPSAKIFWSIRLRRKLVLRAIEAPLTALRRWPTRLVATRGSNTTAALRVVSFSDSSRRTARSPARAPIDASSGMSARWTRPSPQ